MFHGLNTSGINIPIWFADCKIPEFKILTKSITTEVCIIGAGIVGLTTAYQLAEAGKSVVVIDDGKICSGETSRTTGHLCNALDDRYYNLERIFGKKGAKLAAQSHSFAIKEIQRIIKKEKIQCDFERLDGYLFLNPKGKLATLKKELKAAINTGLKVNLLLNPKIDGVKLTTCIRFANQAQFHPLKYLAALAKTLTKMGVKIYEKTHAEEIEPGKSTAIKLKNGKTIKATHVVIATNSPVYDKSKLFSKQEARRTYVIGARVPKGKVKKALYWDTAEPYHYIRTHNTKGNLAYDLLSIGGEDHHAGTIAATKEKFSQLEKWAKKHIPDIKKIDFRWSGQIMEPVDRLAYIGRYPIKKGKIYVATGDSGNGLTHGTIAAILIKDLILGKKNPWHKLYSPSRKPVKSLKNLLKNNIENALSLNKHSKIRVKNLGQLSRNKGTVLSEGDTKIAVYKDKGGHLHFCTAICPHMKGILTWNPVEDTWDCPLHGSRFTPFGEVINGPAISEIKKEKKSA